MKIKLLACELKACLSPEAPNSHRQATAHLEKRQETLCYCAGAAATQNICFIGSKLVVSHFKQPQHNNQVHDIRTGHLMHLIDSSPARVPVR